jgi:hypothetical protein
MAVNAHFVRKEKLICLLSVDVTMREYELTVSEILVKYDLTRMRSYKP